MPVERNSKEAARLAVHVSGRVQGVNFRWFTQRCANDFGLRGWVRNRGDGSVELVAEGERGALENFLDAVRVGPSSAVVESVDTQWSAPTGEFGRFEIRY
ncbi:MAG: acylphosphatase [Anaerolineae bacterium]